MPCRRAIIAPLLLTAAGLALTGCEIWGFLASGFDPKMVPARHELLDQPTLILVDDPQQRLGGTTRPAVVANRLAYELTQQEVLTRIVSQQELADLAAELGDAFAATPVDAVGRALGAAQVIYIYVEDVSLRQGPAVLQPRADVRVKVIDAAASQRLFPAPQAGADLDRGYLVVTELPATTELDEARVQRPAILHKLADRAGIDVARLFHKHRREQIPYDRPGPAD